MKGYLVTLGQEVQWTRIRLQHLLSKEQTDILRKAADILQIQGYAGDPPEMFPSHWSER